MVAGDLDLAAGALLAARGIETDDPLAFAGAAYEARFMAYVTAFIEAWSKKK